MTPDKPIACSLTTDELPARAAEIAAVGEHALDVAEIDGARATLRFRAAPGTRDRLAAIVAAEAECCPFLDMTLDETADGLTLTVVAPPGAEPVAADLVAAFGG